MLSAKNDNIASFFLISVLLFFIFSLIVLAKYLVYICV